MLLENLLTLAKLVNERLGIVVIGLISVDSQEHGYIRGYYPWKKSCIHIHIHEIHGSHGYIIPMAPGQ